VPPNLESGNQSAGPRAPVREEFQIDLTRLGLADYRVSFTQAFLFAYRLQDNLEPAPQAQRTPQERHSVVASFRMVSPASLLKGIDSFQACYQQCSSVPRSSRNRPSVCKVSQSAHQRCVQQDGEYSSGISLRFCVPGSEDRQWIDFSVEEGLQLWRGTSSLGPRSLTGHERV
jgi:hypothetical protein